MSQRPIMPTYLPVPFLKERGRFANELMGEVLNEAMPQRVTHWRSTAALHASLQEAYLQLMHFIVTR
jgi:hypothetical protein